MENFKESLKETLNEKKYVIIDHFGDDIYFYKWELKGKLTYRGRTDFSNKGTYHYDLILRRFNSVKVEDVEFYFRSINENDIIPALYKFGFI
jgi:hypothetical protein